MISRALIAGAVCLPMILAACATGNSASIGSLRGRTVAVEEEKIDGGLEKAIASYKKFIESTPETEMTPEALRRLADLKIEAIDSGYDTDSDAAPGQTKVESPIEKATAKGDKGGAPDAKYTLESIEKRSTQDKLNDQKAPNRLAGLPSGNSVQQQALADDANSKEAIRIYRELLSKYPDFQRNDQVLYQLARAYGVRGDQEDALRTLDRIVQKYPYTNLIDEVQFRRGEILFVRKRYGPAEDAYAAVLKVGRGSDFYDQALYKHGWSLFKQSEYKKALDSFIKLIDYKAAGGRDAIDAFNEIERQRLNDTLRVVSFSFSYLGGAKSISDYFKVRGRRPYEDMLFNDLGEHYLEKRRYADAAESFAAFVERNPLHKLAPSFQMRVIDVYEKGGFPKLVIESKREFARIYHPKSNYWAAHDINRAPKILAFIKQNMVDLARHYHALSQKHPQDNEHLEAIKWYRAFLESFPDDPKAAGLNFLLAEILFENRDYAAAAKEYEKTAYGYARHEKSAEAGYAAILAYREQIKAAPEDKQAAVVRRSITSSLRFADTFPAHEKVPSVLAQAAVDLFERDDFNGAREAARRVIAKYPQSDEKLRRSAWTVVGHASFDLKEFAEAEKGYEQALALMPGRTPERTALVDRLAAAVYKQGEQSEQKGDLRAAVGHFMRVPELAPESAIRVTAEYDAASALMQLKDWRQAANVLEGFRRRYPGHKYQDEVTKKLAVAYEESGRPALAAAEFERIELSTNDMALKREAGNRAAELYEVAEKLGQAIAVYARYVKQFPYPIGPAIEARQHLADLYKQTNDSSRYTSTLREIVKLDQSAGNERSDRTRYLAALATLELSEPVVEEYRKIRLVQPLKASLAKKKKYMQRALDIFTAMLDYGVAEVTAAATFRIADIYYDLTRAILESERPKKLSALELEQYDILLEEQAYPFEEKAINIHKKNVELLEKGVYNEWVVKSIEQLGKLVPVRYAKFERSEPYMAAVR